MYGGREASGLPHVASGPLVSLQSAPIHEDLRVDAQARRSSPRSSMFLAAVIRSGPEQAPVRVRNMSLTGAMIDTPITPAPGTDVQLKRGALVAQGTVVWRTADRCGVRFLSDISISEWLAPPGRAEQQRVDEMVAIVRSGAAHTDAQAPADVCRAPVELSEDVTEVIRLMQDLEEDLSSSDATLEHHGAKLQHLDLAMQMLAAIAREINPGTGAGAQGNARLANLRLACAKALEA